MNSEHLSIETDDDLNRMRQQLRSFAGDCGFTDYESTKLVTAASEISRNVLDYAENGEVTIEMESDAVPVIRVEITDAGPGIDNVDRAMEDGFSGETSKGLGVGLPGTERLSDEFDITSTPGEGTTVTFAVRKDHRR